MEHMAEVRLLTEEDAPALWRLRLEALECEPRAFAETPEEHRQTSSEIFALRLREGRPNHFIVGAFEGESLVGMAGFLRSGGSKARHKGRVWGVYLNAAARGQGIGRQMLDALLEEARGLEGLVNVVLTVAEENRPAVELYRRVGFLEYGRDPCALRVDGAYVPELLMRYDLTETAPSGHGLESARCG
jgi:ribosomal protein S18 acetylase RimI-like enzyme